LLPVLIRMNMITQSAISSEKLKGKDSPLLEKLFFELIESHCHLKKSEKEKEVYLIEEIRRLRVEKRNTSPRK